MDLPVMPPVAPMLAKPVDGIPSGDYVFEPKWDGFRTIVFRDGDEVEFGSRNERPMTRYFPELVNAALAELPSRCVIDGEIVLPDFAAGRLDFEALQLRLHPAASRVRLLAAQTPAHFVAFDLLALGSDDYTERPFAERRAALESALSAVRPPVHLTPATTDRAVAEQWFTQFEGAGLDGLIARSQRNLATLAGWVERCSWADFLAEDRATISCTSPQFKITDPWFTRLSPEVRFQTVRAMTRRLEQEDAAYDIASHRASPPGLRIWTGPTVETADVAALLPWIDWAWEEQRRTAKAA